MHSGIKVRILAGLIFAALALPMLCAAAVVDGEGHSEAGVPRYKVDAIWPQLPDNWSLGQVSAVAIGPDGHVWVLHRPRTVAAPKRPAPPVLEFDGDGIFLRAWGGPGAGYEWPSNEHTIAVDTDGNVWISGNGAGDDAILKFTRDGRFLNQFGHDRSSEGNADRNNVKQAASIFIFEPTHEVFVGDGYGNRRVLVLDEGTLQFKRMWGAFGNVPEDWAATAASASAGYVSHAAPLSDSGRGSSQFALPHSVVVSNDRMVYVADRPNRRIQVFTLQGKYLQQVFINRGGPATETVCGLALSPDPQQKYLYVADYGNSQILIVDRKSLTVLKRFGSRGTGPGQFRGAHSLALDRNGVLYVTEVAPGNRIQRFVAIAQ